MPHLEPSRPSSQSHPVPLVARWSSSLPTASPGAIPSTGSLPCRPQASTCFSRARRTPTRGRTRESTRIAMSSGSGLRSTDAHGDQGVGLVRAQHQEPRGEAGPLRGQRHPYVYELVLALQHMGWRWVETYIWTKPNAIPGRFGPRTKDSFEYVYAFSKGPRPYFDLDAIRVPYKTTSEEIERRKLDDERPAEHRGGFWSRSHQDVRQGWSGSRQCRIGPAKLQPALRASRRPPGGHAGGSRGVLHQSVLLRPGGVVIDPFAGSADDVGRRAPARPPRRRARAARGTRDRRACSGSRADVADDASGDASNRDVTAAGLVADDSGAQHAGRPGGEGSHGETKRARFPSRAWCSLG